MLRETVYDDNEPWWEVEAMVKHPAAVGPAQERRLYVRASALSHSADESGGHKRPGEAQAVSAVRLIGPPGEMPAERSGAS